MLLELLDDGGPAVVQQLQLRSKLQSVLGGTQVADLLTCRVDSEYHSLLEGQGLRQHLHTGAAVESRQTVLGTSQWVIK